MWAMIEKLRMRLCSMGIAEDRSRGSVRLMVPVGHRRRRALGRQPWAEVGSGVW
jgi:hypothetical protein